MVKFIDTKIIIESDTVIQFDLLTSQLNFYSLNNKLGIFNPCFAQLNDNELLIAGGIDTKDTTQISPKVVMFSIGRSLYRLKDMPTPRINIAMVM